MKKRIEKSARHATGMANTLLMKYTKDTDSNKK